MFLQAPRNVQASKSHVLLTQRIEKQNPLTRKKMRRTLFFTTLFILAQNVLSAQPYTVVYEKVIKLDLGNQLDQITDPALKKQLEAQLAKEKSELYELRFKDGNSNFLIKEEKNKTAESIELEGAPATSNVKVIQMGSAPGSSILYKDLNHRIYLKSANLLGKDFLIKDTLPKYDWNLSEETKIVGNYVCKKATTVHNRKEITAWYAPSIPINDGPDEYYGLPGLIIELTDGNITYNVLNVQETPEISILKPNKGKEITKAKYQQLEQERMEAIKQQFKN